MPGDSKAVLNFFSWLDQQGWHWNQVVRSVKGPYKDRVGQYYIINSKKPTGNYKIYENGEVYPYPGAQVRSNGSRKK
jgi:hypothetical protein